jgi:predicted transcriptional regulator
MDLFDEQILTMLSDSKTKVLAQLLNEAGFSRNAVKLHLKRLSSQGLVVKEKIPSNRKGRQKYAYSIPPRIRKQVSAALQDPAITISVPAI